MRDFRRSAAIAVSLLAPGGRLSAAAPPVISSEVTLVQIDAVVTDGEGRVVSGLTREDFELRENGRPQPIRHFDVATAERPVDLRVAAEKPPEPAPQATPAPRGRDVVLMVDDFHLEAAGMARAKDALRRLVEEQLVPPDRVALVTTSGQLAVHARLTTDRASLQRGLQRLAPRSRRSSGLDIQMSAYQAERIMAGDRDALGLAVAELVTARAGFSDGELTQREVLDRARAILSESSAAAAHTLATVEGTLRTLAPLPGRKVLVLVTEGFLIGTGTGESKQLDMKQITDAATRAGVVVYSLDVRGLTAPGDLSAAGPVISSMPGVRERLTSEGEKAQRDGMDALAAETGGFMVTRTNDLKGALGKILDDTSFYYVLAYEPPEPHDGSYRRVEVHIPRHPELRIRARKGFYAPGGKGRPREKKEEPARAALTSLLPLSEIPVRFSADFAGPDAGASQIALNAWIDVSGLPLEKVAGRYQAALDVLSAVYDEDGKGVQSAQEKMDLKMDEAKLQSVARSGLAFQKPLAVSKPGFYLVRLAVHDPRSRSAGNAAQWVHIPDLAKEPLALSGVFLSSGPASGEGLRSIQALRRAAAGEALLFQFFVYRPRQAPGDLTLEVHVDHGGRRIVSLPPAPITVEEKDGVLLPQAGRISLAGFPPADYELIVIVTERPSGASASGRAAFRVD